MLVETRFGGGTITFLESVHQSLPVELPYQKEARMTKLSLIFAGNNTIRTQKREILSFRIPSQRTIPQRKYWVFPLNRNSQRYVPSQWYAHEWETADIAIYRILRCYPFEEP